MCFRALTVFYMNLQSFIMKYNFFKKFTLKHWVIAFVIVCFMLAVKLAIIMEQKGIPDIPTLISKIVKKVSDGKFNPDLVRKPVNATTKKSSNPKSVIKPETLYKDWVKLSWAAPTEYTNGEPLHDLAGFRIYYWTERNSKKQIRDVKNVLSYKLENLDYGETYYFAVTAYNKNFVESVYSKIKAVKLVKPIQE